MTTSQKVETFKFHANPVPKAIYNPPKIPIRSTTPVRAESPKPVKESQKQQLFKARPAKVLYSKPFEPKYDTRPLTEITEFHLNADKRVKERAAYEEELRKKQENIEKLKKEVNNYNVSVKTL